MSKARVLLVDDEGIFLLAHREELESAGYDVQIALTGKEAVALAQREHFDVVFVDLIMPRMSGIEVCREIRQLSPRTVIVLVSGYPYELDSELHENQDVGESMEKLSKPLREDELTRTVERLLKK